MPLVVAIIVEITCLIFGIPKIWAFIYALLVLWIGGLTTNRLLEKMEKENEND